MFNKSVHLLVKRNVKHITSVNYVRNFIQRSPVKANPMGRGNCWGSSAWI